MSWETHEAAERIADGWYSELEETRKRNAVLGRENARLRELCASLYEFSMSEYPDGTELNFADRMRELGVIE